jgi:hypothetical protein
MKFQWAAQYPGLACDPLSNKEFTIFEPLVVEEAL